MSRRARRRLVVYPAVMVSYFVAMVFGGCVDKLLLHPSTEPADASGATRRTVDFGNGRVIECWVKWSPGAVRAGRPAAYAVEFTGNATRAEWVAVANAERWGGRAVEVWTVNYPGFGGSTGPARVSDIPPMAVAVYEEVAKGAAEGGGARRPIFAGGNSLGTAAALYLATQRPVAGLTLQNPPALRSLLLRQYGWWNLWLVAGPIALAVPGELDSPTNAAKVNVPAVYLHADQDALVVPANQRLVSDAHAGPKRVIGFAGDHNGGAPPAGEVQGALDWLWAGAGLAPVND